MSTANGSGRAPGGHFAGRTLTELALDLRAGSTTSVELTRQALDAIARLDSQLNAFITVDPDGAMAAARQADAELARGVDRGPLHGLPSGVKDVIMVKGLPATMGSRHFAGYVPDADAACVTLLREAGGVIVGKTNTHEFAYGPTGDRSAAGPSLNPRDTSRMPGGSSSGSAVAVAAGMVPFALGTDTGGSVRIPAALCGVSGFKPSYGTLPADGVFPLSKTLDHVGLLAGDAESCLVAYRALVPGGSRPRAVRADAAQHRPERPAGGRPRAAWLDPATLFPCDPRVAHTARQALEARTGPVEELRLSPQDADALREAFVSIQSHEVIEVHAGRLADDPGLFDAEVLGRLRAAATVPARRYAPAMRTRNRLIETIGGLFGHHDVLATPTVPITAPLLGRRELDLNGTPVAVRDALLSLTSPWNVLGLPALSVAAGTVDGLPVGLQLVCRPGSEHLLFQAATLHTPREKARTGRRPAAGTPARP